MIHHYEEVGLVPAAMRTSAGYRQYTEADIHQTMKATLAQLVRCCRGDDRPECPILETLAQEKPPCSGPGARPDRPQ